MDEYVGVLARINATAPSARPLRFTLLVVDDNDDALEVLTTFFRACGAHPLKARNALGALAYLDTQPIDAIITDLSMPDMDGVELVRRVRAHPTRWTLPVIALTGFYENYMDTPFNAFLQKPADFDLLCRTIRSVIDPTDRLSSSARRGLHGHDPSRRGRSASP